MNKNPDHANVKVAPPLLTLLHLGLAFLLNRLFPFPTTLPPVIRWPGILVVLVGLVLAFQAAGRFRRAGTTLDPHSPVSTLVTNGPYRFSRNPIYLGFTCILIGLPLSLGTYWGIILSPLFVLLMGYLVIQHEEAYLRRRFGDIYGTYRKQVRRWV